MRAASEIARDRVLPLVLRIKHRRAYPRSGAILIVQPDHLGDVLLSQPAVRSLRHAFPDAKLVALVGPWSEEIARRSWDVDQIETFEFPGFTRAPKRSLVHPYRLLWKAALKVRALRPSAAVVLRPDAWWSVWMLHLAGVPRIVAADDPRNRSFATDLVPAALAGHRVTRAIAVVSALADEPGAGPMLAVSDALSLQHTSEGSTSAADLLNTHGIRSPYAIVHPGAGAAVKRWPIERWRSVVRFLCDRGLSVVVTGSSSESALCDSIAVDKPSVTSLAGRTPLETLIEIVRGAEIVVGPDCGPLHIAVAVGTPTVHIYGPSDPELYGPWGPANRHIVLTAGWNCPRCGDLSDGRPEGCGCMLAISEEQVISVARELV